MHPIKYTLFIIGILCVASCNQPNKKLVSAVKIQSSSADTGIFYQDTGYSSILLKCDTLNEGYPTIEAITHTKVFHYIQYQQYYSGLSAPWHAIIAETSEQHAKDAPGPTDDKGIIILNTFVPNTNPPSTSNDVKNARHWQDTVSANEVRYADEYIDFVTNRDNQAPPYPAVHNIYSYDQGKKIMTFSSDFYGLESVIDEPKRRYVGFLDDPYDCGFDEKLLNNNVDGILSYVDPIEHRTQYLFITYLTSDDGTGNDSQVEVFDQMNMIGLKESATYHSSDHSHAAINNERWGYTDFKNLTISLKFTGEFNATLLIPVVNDSIDISNIHSNQFKLEVIR